MDTQVNLFFDYLPSFDAFQQIRSLSFHSIRSIELAEKIVDHCSHLPHLAYLELYIYQHYCGSSAYQSLINQICTLSRLRHLTFVGSFIISQDSPIPESVSLSLESLRVILHYKSLHVNEIHQLLKQTPALKHLDIRLEFGSERISLREKFPLITHLVIDIMRYFDVAQIESFLEKFPNLDRLSIVLPSPCINGHQWEQIIRKNLPKLKIFQLRMREMLAKERKIEERFNELYNSFRSSFWIKEHQWFFHCLRTANEILIYSLPYTLSYYEDDFPNTIKSTKSDKDSQQEFSSNIIAISHSDLFPKLNPSNVRLCRLQHLEIRLTTNELFYSAALTLNNLRSLVIDSYDDTLQNHLQSLLHRTHQLRKISIYQNRLLPLQTTAFQCQCATIRELSFKKSFNTGNYFNKNDCLLLSDSSLGKQCEILNINVCHCEDIVHLVKNMPQLHTLTVECETDQNFCEYGRFFIDEEFLQWLKDSLPSAYIVTTDPAIGKIIRIWS